MNNRYKGKKYPDSSAIGFKYDAAGNRTQMIINNDTTVNYVYDDENRLLLYSSGVETTVFQYDNNGNMIYKANGGDTYNLTFDIENRLVKVQKSDTITDYIYTPFGLRYRKTSGNDSVTYLYDNQYNVIAEYNSDIENIVKYVFYETDKPVYQQRGDTVNYYLLDGLGSVMQLIDENENTANTYEYDVFGTVTASSGTAANDLKFTGKRFDAESGLYYYNTRYYDALTGRFISKDKLYYEILMNNELNRLFLNIQSVMPLAEEQLPMQQIIDLKNYVETPQRLQPIIGQDDGIVYYMYRIFGRLERVLKSIGFDIKYFDMDSIDKFRNPQELNYYVYALNNPANLIDKLGGCGGKSGHWEDPGAPTKPGFTFDRTIDKEKEENGVKYRQDQFIDDATGKTVIVDTEWTWVED